MDDKEYVPEHVQDMIINEYIRRLLYNEEDCKVDDDSKPFNPYSLDSKVPFRFESRFKHGIKELPPAYKKTKPASKSAFECEFMREVNGELNLSGVYNVTGTVPVSLTGSDELYYVPVSSIKQMLRDSVTQVSFKPCAGGTKAVAKIEVDKQVLIDSIKRV